MSDQWIRWFHETSIADVPVVGGKNASLGEMYRALAEQGVRVPNGFATTADAYRHFLQSTGLDRRIRAVMSEMRPDDVPSLQQAGHAIRQAILSTELPTDFQSQVSQAYEKLCSEAGTELDVAVRSSATAEDLPDASFAGQQETYLNVQGVKPLLETCRRCFASLFTDRAISYRNHKGFDHFQIALSIGVQRMVRSDLASSGVLFSLDTETGFRDVVLINAAYGLGENVVQGAVTPDEFLIFKPTLQQGFRPILQKRLGSKEWKMVYDIGGGRMTRNLPTPVEERSRFSISDDEVLTLARWAIIIEEHYAKQRGVDSPMDIEWAKDGRTGELWIVQARPETVQSRRDLHIQESFHLETRSELLVKGRSVGEKIGQGPVHIISSAPQLAEFRQGEVLVADKTDPDWEPAMKKAAAIITNRGGRTCHAAIVSRELGLPAVVGSGNATSQLKNGQAVTVCCAEGEEGRVYAGLLRFTKQQLDLRSLPKPRTKVMVNVGNPEEALRLSFLPHEGVGLAREEFIISTTIKVHPQALLD
ncbi:MAG TPA: phosphoenolpyruvate synthase, partial [Planctomycetaceae bacterium]|nr:phosphoenolpyruvate synthase [Planctomycetaceae bacterium]